MLLQGVEVVKVDIVTFNAMLDGCFDVNEGKETIALFHKMKERGVSLTLYTYNIMLKYLFRLKQIFNPSKLNHLILLALT